MDLKKQIEKFRSRHGRMLNVGDTVIFNGGTMNKGIITEIKKDDVKIKVPTSRDYMSQDGKIDGRSFVKHKSEIIKRYFTPEDFSEGMSFLFCNKFGDEKLGNIEIKWRDSLREDIMTLLPDAKLINSARPGGDNCWKYIVYEKSGKKYIIPATSILGIPTKLLNEYDTGITNQFEITEDRSQFVIPLGMKPRIGIDDLKRAYNITIESRKVHAMNELARVRQNLVQTTEQLAGFKRQNTVLSDTIRQLEDQNTDEERLKRAKHVIEDQWDDFKVEGTESGTTISVGSYIYHTVPKTKKTYDIGYCTINIHYPSNIGSAPSVKINNSNKRSGYPHPYVSNDGRPCYGNASTEAAEALGSGDFERYLGFLYEYLTNSEGSPYINPTEWTEVEAKER